VKIEPDNGRACLLIGQLLATLGFGQDSFVYFRRAVELMPQNVEACAKLGMALLNEGSIDEARAWSDKALALAPDNPDAAAFSALLAEMRGDVAAAIELLRPHVNSDSVPAACTFAVIAMKTGREPEAVSWLERLLGKPSLAAERVNLHFGLGRLYDAIAGHDRAFGHFRQGNDLKPRAFDPAEFSEETRALIELFTCDFVARMPRATNGSELPVFIVGMPRSGTSLVEQILGMHPALHAAGELPDIGDISSDLPRVVGAPAVFPGCLATLSPESLDRLARTYLDKIESLRGSGQVRVTDKAPLNGMKLGLIAMLFPRARVIHCLRDPLDTCLSCYFQNFAAGLPYSFTTDLGYLGAFYREYDRLMSHWKRVLPLPVLEVRYENLVADQEGVTRRMLEFCGLEWDAGCLRYYNSRRLVHTASYDQVRRPIYASSVGRWKYYERHIEPLKRTLSRRAL
jgi:tetratricopeptide (TPR) repeat protein